MELCGETDLRCKSGSYLRTVPYYNPLAQALGQLIGQKKSVKSLSDLGQLYLPGQFKRVYVEKGFGIPFFSGRSIGELDPSDKKYLSFSQHGKQIAQLQIKENMLLVTCSGTLGNVALVPKHWDGYAMTHDIIRVVCKSPEIAAYSYAWLSSEYGKCLILKHSYGAVVQHIEDHHLATVPVPLLEEKLIEEIGQKVLLANAKRTEAFGLEQQALALFNSKVLGL
jgi:type I restriction enzyme, S subunit